MVEMEGVAWLHGAAPEMERRGRGMEIDIDSGLARSALTMWRRRTLHPDHIHTGEEKRGGDTYAGCSCCYNIVLYAVMQHPAFSAFQYKMGFITGSMRIMNINVSPQHEDLC